MTAKSLKFFLLTLGLSSMNIFYSFGSQMIKSTELKYKWESGNTYLIQFIVFAENLEQNQNNEPVEAFIHSEKYKSSSSVLLYPAKKLAGSVLYSNSTTLPALAPDWIISINSNSNNAFSKSDVNKSGIGFPILKAMINNELAVGNTSCELNNSPLYSICSGMDFNYNAGLSDANGDSLGINLNEDPIISADDATFPANIFLNPSSNNIVLNFPKGKTAFLTIQVNEYRNGKLIGYTSRISIVKAVECQSVPAAISGIDGTNNYNEVVCPGFSLCFDLFSTLKENTIRMVSAPANAVFSEGDHFCWAPTESDARHAPYYFTFSVIDPLNPENPVQSFGFSIRVPKIEIQFETTTGYAADQNTYSLKASPSGGSGNYVYLWNFEFETSQELKNVKEGNYTVSIMDDYGCEASGTTLVTSSYSSVLR